MEEGKERRCMTMGWFMSLLVTFVVMQSLINTGLVASSLSTIELRYSLSSTSSSVIPITSDISTALFVGCATYAGARHKPRALWFGLFMMGTGSLIFAFPHFFSDEYTVDGREEPQVCGGPPSTTLEKHCADDGTGLYFFFILAQICFGCGSACLYTLGPAFIDENAPNDKVNVYLGVFYAASALGPALGFILSGSFLSVWVNPGNEPSDITTTDSQWVGAWWIGFVIAAIFSVSLSFLFCFYPAHLPGTETVRELKRRSSEVIKGNEIEDDVQSNNSVLNGLRAYAQVGKNRTVLFNSIAVGFETFTIAGGAVFLPKITENVYSITASEASFAVGLVIIPGAAGGIFVGGWLMKRFGLSGLKQARLIVVIAIITFLLEFAFFLSCDNTAFAGVTTQYVGDASTSLTLAATCNNGCGCVEYPYDPVCGSDGIQYFNSCFAACTTLVDGTGVGTGVTAEFTGCGCVSEALQTATGGKCDATCDHLGLWLFVLFIVMFGTFLPNVLGINVVLRSLPLEQRASGLGFQNWFYRLVGTIPGPVVFGASIDAACNLWDDACDGGSACWSYDNDDMMLALLLLILVPKAASIVFFYLSYRSYAEVLDTQVGGHQDHQKVDVMEEVQVGFDATEGST